MKNESSASQERGINLANRLSLSFIGVTTLILLIGLAIAYLNFRIQFTAQLRQRLLDIVSIAALQQDGDAFINIHSGQDPAYETIRLKNLKIRSSDTDLRFLYTMRFDNNGLYFVVDATYPGEPDASAFGDRYLKPGPVLGKNYKTIDHPLVEGNFYTDEFGTFLSAYAPFYTSNAQLAGIIGADISAEKVLRQERQVLIQFVLIFILLLPVVGYMGWLLGNRLAKPIISITSAAKRFSDGDLDYRPTIRTRFSEVRILRDTFFSMSDQLLSLIRNMEKRITERTQSLEKRTARTQLAARIARDTSIAPDVDAILDRSTQLIHGSFGFYHVGIYIQDTNKEYMVLRSAAGDAGKLMLANKHKIRVGEADPIAKAVESGEVQIVLNSNTEADHVRNPLLPYTRSEIILPMRARNQVVGVIDIQSDKADEFDQDDIAIMQILADQISISLERANLVEELTQSAMRLEQASQEGTSKAWQAFLQQGPKFLGYQYEGVTFEPLTTTNLEGFEMSLKNETTISDGEDRKSKILAVPIRLRGQILGTLKLNFQGGGIPQETVRLVEDAANRLALALENARLVAEAQQRAEREQVIGQITTRMRETLDIETILKTAVTEIRQSLELREAEVRLHMTEDGTSTEVSHA